MKGHILLWFIPAIFALSACGNHGFVGPKPLASTIEANTPDAFRARFASFEITPSDLRRFELRKLQHFTASQEVGNAGASRLTLQIGARTGPPNALRTRSRYRVLDELGRVTAEAESTLALPDLSGEAESSIIVLTDRATQTYFVAEEQSWATQRYILFQSGKAEYVKIPLPDPGIMSTPVAPRFKGIRDGRLYVEILGRFYALPLDTLERDADLGYSIG